jgi:hypothetical protein
VQNDVRKMALNVSTGWAEIWGLGAVVEVALWGTAFFY